MNNSLHIIDDNLNPDPMTAKGTKDLVEMFYVLKKASRKPIVNNNHNKLTTEIF